MINPDVITHLEKYFELSRTQFIEGNHALAAFFAITTIEEAAKLLILEGNSSEARDRNELLKESRNHRSKYFGALINLIEQSPQYETMPPHWKSEIDSWWDADKLMKIRNDCLYLRYGRNNQVTTPQKAIDIELAALLVYTAGVTIAELDEYISGLPSGWKKSILEVANIFRQGYLKR